ncbi:SseB family protein [Lactococcus protaetiae]|uniref:SseB family protein n=1 Tax=Lactococcus protaetiae TaxID=2592653 RepID=A0A514ZB67_9LACT|nr:SseB family protein [Lactococcus protaetiae]MCL2113727.1 SseB family protein [Streptococcaceae bacterium]QDK71822.1 SseB family protein [Lactococcus protaetiae]
MNEELEPKLRAAIANKRLIDELDFMVELKKTPVFALKEKLCLNIRENKVLPVFTSKKSAALFQANFEQKVDFDLCMIDNLLQNTNDADTIGFNVRPLHVENRGNQQYWSLDSFRNMQEKYEKLLAEFALNARVGKLERRYFVPAFVDNNNALAGSERRFAALTAPDERSYIPLFDNFESLLTWYSEPYFQHILNDNSGEILVMTIDDLMNPKTGRNEFSFAAGVTINPLDYDISEFEKTLVSWAQLRGEV